MGIIFMRLTICLFICSPVFAHGSTRCICGVFHYSLLHRVCTLLVHPFHASAALFPFLLGTMSSFHNAWEDGLVPVVALALLVLVLGSSPRTYDPSLVAKCYG
eukprot:Gb_29326 [translate_table: standard]